MAITQIDEGQQQLLVRTQRKQQLSAVLAGTCTVQLLRKIEQRLLRILSRELTLLLFSHQVMSDSATSWTAACQAPILH